MKNFLVLYGATAKAIEGWKNQSAEQGEEDMKVWIQWMEENSSHLVDPGNPIGKNTRLYADGTSEEKTNELCGYLILQANDRDDAIEILKSSPHTQNSEMYIELMNIVDMEI